jgi:hypothetical protein
MKLYGNVCQSTPSDLSKLITFSISKPPDPDLEMVCCG